jgi:hypothetical protein
MSNTMRWRYGDTNPIMVPVLTESMVEIGDLIYMASGTGKPAADLADLGTKAANQEAFHDAFVGVAMQCSPAGSVDPIRVATSGVFELDCASATAAVGDLFGIEEDGSGTELLSQTVVKVATANLAVGRCAKQVNPASTRVLVDIVSTVMRGGPQVMA